MLPEELRELAAKVRAQRAEAQFLEVKAAKDGCPKRVSCRKEKMRYG